MKFNKARHTLFFTSLLVLSACGGGSGGSSNPPPTTPPPAQGTQNSPPTISLESSFTVDERSELSINPTISDSDGTVSTVNWTQLSGPQFTIEEQSSTLLRVTAPDVAADGDSANFELEAIDDDGASTKASFTIEITNVNRAPVINGDANLEVSENEEFTYTLDVSDPDDDGSISSVEWVQTGGETVELVAQPSSTLQFTAPEVDNQNAVLEFRATATDELGLATSFDTQVTVNNINVAPTPPTFVDVNVLVGNTVVLDASNAFDEDGDTISYSWSVEGPSNSSAQIADSTAPITNFTPDVEGDFLVTLLLSDPEEAQASSSFTITAENENLPPSASAGDDLNVNTGATVQLNGTGSSDPEGAELSYQWSLQVPEQSSATLDDENSATPSFVADVDGSYVATLVVSDGELSSNSDSVTVVAQTANSAPTANAGIDINAGVGEMVTLTGAASSDADNDVLSYQWSVVSSPEGSSPSLSMPDSMETEFTPDTAGVYVFRLTVSDGVDTDFDNVSVIVVDSAVQVCAINEFGGSEENCMRFPWGSVNSSSFATQLSNGEITLQTLRIKAEGRSFNIEIALSDDTNKTVPKVVNSELVFSVSPSSPADFSFVSELVEKGVARPVFTINAPDEGLTIQFNYEVTIL